MGSFLVRIYDPAYPPDVVPVGGAESLAVGIAEASSFAFGDLVEVPFVWDAVSGATSYVLKVGTTSMQATGNIYDGNVGNVITYPVNLVLGGTYYGRSVVVGGAHAGELTANGEQTVTV